MTVLIHSGSHGLGHQVCTDFVRRMDATLDRHGIRLPDRQLSCAPASSEEGRAYLAAMAAAANFAWANRHAIAHGVRQAVRRVLGDGAAEDTAQVYDVAHNVAKRERHDDRDVLVHRKGATRAFPLGHPDVPHAYQHVGQPVFIPGSMGTSSFVLAGRAGAMERSFGTVCHGAGRALSRTRARKQIGGAELRRQLEQAHHRAPVEQGPCRGGALRLQGCREGRRRRRARRPRRPRRTAATTRSGQGLRRHRACRSPSPGSAAPWRIRTAAASWTG